MGKGKSAEKIDLNYKQPVIREEDRLSIMEDLFHKLKYFVVSLEGYASLFLNEYGTSLDSKGKHYIKRIKGNMKEIDWVIRMLQECIKV